MTGVISVDTERDRRGDRVGMLMVVGIILVIFAIGSTLQTVFLFRPERLDASELVLHAPMLGIRLAVNLGTVLTVLISCAATRLHERPRRARAGTALAIACAAGAVRHGAQLLVGIYPGWEPRVSSVEIGSVVAVTLLALTLALAQVRARRQLRTQIRASAQQQLRAAAVLAEMSTQEVRVRREIAEGLHGTLQGRLVMTQARLGAVLRRVREERVRDDIVEQLLTLRDELDEIRERDVREFSQLVYPVGIDIGLGHAVRTLVRRLPADIAVHVEIDADADSALQGDSSDAVARRIALVRTVEEGITNALRHGAATDIRIAGGLAASPAGTEGAAVRVTVDNDGARPAASATWSGLARAAERLGVHEGSLRLGGSDLGGARLEITVPVACVRAR